MLPFEPDALPNGASPGTPSGLRPSTRPREASHDGRTLGGFYLAREIACGGMGQVFLAHRTQHARIGQTAAVKVIHPRWASDRDFINMFLDEARIASSITHPNVCRVLDFGQADGTYYLAMEYVTGETLGAVLSRLYAAPATSSMAEPLIRYALHQVCEALHAAHEAEDAQGKPLGVVHRDISPQNIMIGYDGSVRVLDFGSARASERLHVTRAGEIKGRTCYMSPEQMRGAEVDCRADVWSVGVVLWEGLSGRRLFKRATEVQTALAVTLDPIPLVTHPTRALSASLQGVVARALERDLAARYATPRELGADLMRSDSSLPFATASDVSAWMRTSFAAAIVQKRVLLREAADKASAAHGREPKDLATSDGSAEATRDTRAPVVILPEVPPNAVSRSMPSASDSRTLRELKVPTPHSWRHSRWLKRSARLAPVVGLVALLLGAPLPCADPALGVDTKSRSMTGSPPEPEAELAPTRPRDVAPETSAQIASGAIQCDHDIGGALVTHPVKDDRPHRVHSRPDGRTRAPKGSFKTMSGDPVAATGDARVVLAVAALPGTEGPSQERADSGPGASAPRASTAPEGAGAGPALSTGSQPAPIAVDEVGVDAAQGAPNLAR